MPSTDHSDSSTVLFPRDFLWGVATAAYQVEGASEQRGASIWDEFCRIPGRIADGSSGRVACDHYHRFPGDVALMAELGLSAYRFSISWPRIMPLGRGRIDTAGVDFYARLIDELLAVGIEPVPTLYHWDLPQALEEEGGWLVRSTAERFADYARAVAARLGDRVTRWITLNEPFVHMAYGYAFGVHAPGRTLMFDALPVAHHQLLAHALAARALRDGGHQVLLAHNHTPVVPASGAPQDRAAAQVYDALHNRLLLDPLLLGRYPDLAALAALGAPDLGDFVRDADLDLMAGSLDGLGVNYYMPTLVAAPGPGEALPFALPDYTSRFPGTPVTAFGWPVAPEGLYRVLTGLRDRYGAALPPLHVTENGCSRADTPDGAGRVADPERIDYLDRHLRALVAAKRDGVDVRGYFVWSLLDNFEWAEGFTQRFGLVHVDYRTQARTPKDSFAWYRDRIARARAGTA
ncbi:beta-glucosidase [Marinactinospora thermotolerans DSM 45154]|uniref:Beta-glucosidase n=1 Tax=Marinactinospora thermotolerans DSM 45154 TaxID=1122192 RepID=A0A1T4T1S7_9ACTN|nr:GH1 family beta-glucosidase [Marinactinospora thermotolerans]SKA34444.1 beta-glucosidase [Marinactinospora thermotolerans DSM 45154]